MEEDTCVHCGDRAYGGRDICGPCCDVCDTLADNG